MKIALPDQYQHSEEDQLTTLASGQGPDVRDIMPLTLDELQLRIYCADSLTLSSKSEVILSDKLGLTSRRLFPEKNSLTIRHKTTRQERRT